MHMGDEESLSSVMYHGDFTNIQLDNSPTMVMQVTLGKFSGSQNTKDVKV